MCSHFNAARYWAYSLGPKQERHFASRQCQNWDDFENGKCQNNTVNYIGISANPKLRGMFFIKVKTKNFYDGKVFYNWLLKRIGNRANNLLNFNF